MAEKHDEILSQYRARLAKRNYKLEGRNPFVDYRPDIYASHGKTKVFVEVEIAGTLHSDHTLRQLLKMYSYLEKDRTCQGYLIVPREVGREAQLLLDSVFGDDKIKVVSV